MQLAEPLAAAWKARLALRFEERSSRTVLAERRADGPLAVQKPLYPEGSQLCHAIVVHPPGGIAAGDELGIDLKIDERACALLTTPGAGKWYRSCGPWARQSLAFDVAGSLEWLPRETIIFDGAAAELHCEIRLGPQARYIGWEIICLGRIGSGERFDRGRVKLDTRIYRDGKPLWFERADIAGGGRLLDSPAGLAGKSVFATLVATADSTALVAECRKTAATTALPGLIVSRYLGDSTEEASNQFVSLWQVLRPAVVGREAVAPRIWST